MTTMFRRRGRIALILVLAALGSAVGALVMTSVFARPKAAPTDLLGADWECGQVLFMTSCTRHAPVTPALRDAHEPRRQATNLPRV